MHVLFCSTVFFIGLPWDSTWTIKGLVKVLCLIPSCIAKLVTSTVLKFCNSHPSLPLEALFVVPHKHGLTAFFHLRFKSHGDFPKL